MMSHGRTRVLDGGGVSARLLAVAFLVGVINACGAGAPAPVSDAPAEAAAPAPADADTAQIVGTVPALSGGVVSIILLDSHVEIEVPLPEEVPVMDQYGRAFNPEFLLVRSGQIIRFTNSEDDLHTVHVKDSAGESLFNIATLFGSSYEFTFDREDSYDVMCNTHTEMFADLMVVGQPVCCSGGPRRRLHHAGRHPGDLHRHDGDRWGPARTGSRDRGWTE